MGAPCSVCSRYHPVTGVAPAVNAYVLIGEEREDISSGLHGHGLLGILKWLKLEFLESALHLSDDYPHLLAPVDAERLIDLERPSS